MRCGDGGMDDVLVGVPSLRSRRDVCAASGHPSDASRPTETRTSSQVNTHSLTWSGHRAAHGGARGTSARFPGGCGHGVGYQTRCSSWWTGIHAAWNVGHHMPTRAEPAKTLWRRCPLSNSPLKTTRPHLLPEGALKAPVGISLLHAPEAQTARAKAQRVQPVVEPQDHELAGVVYLAEPLEPQP